MSVDESAPEAAEPTRPTAALWRKGIWIGLILVAIGAALQGIFAFGTEEGTNTTSTAISWGLTGLGIVIYVISRIWGLWVNRARA